MLYQSLCCLILSYHNCCPYHSYLALNSSIMTFKLARFALRQSRATAVTSAFCQRRTFTATVPAQSDVLSVVCSSMLWHHPVLHVVSCSPKSAVANIGAKKLPLANQRAILNSLGLTLKQRILASKHTRQQSQHSVQIQ